jgi:hypothetical protein
MSSLAVQTNDVLKRVLDVGAVPNQVLFAERFVVNESHILDAKN